MVQSNIQIYILLEQAKLFKVFMACISSYATNLNRFKIKIGLDCKMSMTNFKTDIFHGASQFRVDIIESRFGEKFVLFRSNVATSSLDRHENAGTPLKYIGFLPYLSDS